MVIRAWKRIVQDRPLIIAGSLMCTALRAWKLINNTKRDSGFVAEEKRRAIARLDFCMQVYTYQARSGRQFLH